MRVRFDLRPEEFAERERRRRSFSLTRLISLLLLALFVLVCVRSTALNLLEVWRLREGTEALEGDAVALEAKRAALIQDLSRLQQRERRAAKRLEALHDLPSLEVLSALEANMVPGMKLKSIQFLPGEALVTAVATEAGGPLSLTESLSRGGGFSDVRLTASQGTLGGVEFTLSLLYPPIAERGAALP